MLSKTPAIQWSSYPLFDYPKKSVFLLSFLLLIGGLLWYITIGLKTAPFLYLLGILFTAIELSPYFIETHYELYDHKISKIRSINYF